MTALVLASGPALEKVRIMTLSYAADRYLGELGRQGRAARTLARYRSYLEKLAYMFPHIDVEDVTTDMVRRFLDQICTDKHGQPLDVDTQSQRVCIIKNFFDWLEDEEFIPADPAKRLAAPKRKNPIENDRIVTVTTEQTQRMLTVAARDLELKATARDQYRALICLGALAYTGGRRHAIAQARIKNYDALGEPHPTLELDEKGGKYIRKPVPAKYAEILRSADLAGVWTDPSDYLVPSISSPRKAVRDDRVIYAIVKKVADAAGVEAHVHALRAAFAVYFIDSKPEQLLALKELMGHADVATTMVYLRRMNRQRNMATVVDLDWGEGDSPSKKAALTVTQPVAELPARMGGN